MLNVAIHGMGNWGRRLIDSCAGSGKIRFVCGITRNPNTHKDYAAKAGIKLVTSYEAVLADKSIDAVVLATPHSHHEAQVIAAAKAGKPVYVEKPLALTQASAILQHHLDVFVGYDKNAVEFEVEVKPQDDEKAKLKKLLNMSVNEIELSVRAANCLNNANITTVGQLAMKYEGDMLKYRNFGKKSLQEIKDKLQALGLSLGMTFDAALLDAPKEDKPAA